MIGRLLRAAFYTGRHHVRTAGRDAGALVTVSTIAARLRREAQLHAIGSAYVEVVPDVYPFDNPIRRALIGIGRSVEQFERVTA